MTFRNTELTYQIHTCSYMLLRVYCAGDSESMFCEMKLIYSSGQKKVPVPFALFETITQR